MLVSLEMVCDSSTINSECGCSFFVVMVVMVIVVLVVLIAAPPPAVVVVVVISVVVKAEVIHLWQYARRLGCRFLGRLVSQQQTKYIPSNLRASTSSVNGFSQ